MERSEAYAYIQANNLKDEVFARYGTNYTRTTTDKLVAFVEEKQKKDLKKDSVAEPDAQEVNSAYEAACLAFLGVLEDAGLLDNLLAKV